MDATRAAPPGDRRRALLWTIGLLSCAALLFVSVGRHPAALAPLTTLPAIGEWDASVYGAVDEAWSSPLDLIARTLHVIGRGLVTIPLRIAVSVWLAVRRRWRAFAAWTLALAASEILTSGAKAFFHRGRPSGALVETYGYSLPSGHATAAAATAIALLLLLVPPGRSRVRWGVVAVGFSVAMALSRVYLRAHWLSDVVTGLLLGMGVVVGCFALLGRDTQVRPAEPRAPG